jgi:hypothetical protein
VPACNEGTEADEDFRSIPAEADDGEPGDCDGDGDGDPGDGDPGDGDPGDGDPGDGDPSVPGIPTIPGDDDPSFRPADPRPGRPIKSAATE